MRRVRECVNTDEHARHGVVQRGSDGRYIVSASQYVAGMRGRHEGGARGEKRTERDDRLVARVEFISRVSGAILDICVIYVCVPIYTGDWHVYVLYVQILGDI
jgi:hypothetical protein